MEKGKQTASDIHSKKRKEMQRIKKVISRRIGMGIITVYNLLTAMFVLQLIRLNVLPLKYLLPVILVLIVLAAGVSYYELMRKKSRIKRYMERGAAVILSVFLACGGWYVHRTGSFLDSLTDSTNKSSVSVIVLKDSSAESIKDLKSAQFGRSKSGTQESVTKALAEISEQTGTDIKPTDYSSIKEFGNALLDKEVDALILDETMRSMVTDEFSDFDSQTKIIKTYGYERKSKENDNGVPVTKEAFNVYITGMDTYGPVETEGRSDVNLILTINPETHQILMTSIPRDYYIPQTCQDNLPDKLTHTGLWGVQYTLSSVENYFDIELNYYARVNFTGIWDIIDAIGGIDIDNPYDFTGEAGNFHFEKGNIHLTGEQALCYARERKSFAAEDDVRIQNQGRVLEGIINKVTSPSILARYTDIMQAVGNAFETNMNRTEMSALVQMQIEDMPSWSINKIQVTGENRDDMYSPANGSTAWVTVPDEASVADAVKIINATLAGEDTTALLAAYAQKNTINDDYSSDNPMHGVVNDEGVYEEATDVPSGNE